MILLDYNAVATGALFSKHRPDILDENSLRHLILNWIRFFNHKHRSEFGRMVICCDNTSWRRDFFPGYKANRKKKRDADDIDWNLVHSMFDRIREEITENMPYPVVHIPGAEGDDVISALVRTTEEFTGFQPVLIVSSDKDFQQLQRLKNVKQFSPSIDGWYTLEEDPERYIFEHVCRGDSSDGVPNVLSDVNTFVDGKTQTRLMGKKIDGWFEGRADLRGVMGQEVYGRYLQNQLLIDLSKTPDAIVQAVVASYNSQLSKGNKKVLNYLIESGCPLLAAECENFFTYQ